MEKHFKGKINALGESLLVHSVYLICIINLVSDGATNKSLLNIRKVIVRLTLPMIMSLMY